MFCIVETIENGLKLVTAVPKIWVNENILRWPAKRSELQNGRKKCISPASNWENVPCKVLLNDIADWETAFEKESEFEYLFTSSDECVNSPLASNILENTNELNFNEIMSEIATTCVQQDVDKVNSDTSKRYNNITTVEFEDVTVQQELLDEIRHMRKSLDICVENFDKHVANYNKHVENTEVAFNTIINMLSVKQNKLEHDLDDLENLCEVNLDLPLSTKESLESLEKKLNVEPLLKKNLISKLATFGGLDGPKTIRTISKFLFDDNLLTLFSWGGTSNKHNFSVYKELFSVIVDAVRCRHKTFSNYDGSKFYKEYIKQAKFRLQSKKSTIISSVEITTSATSSEPTTSSDTTVTFTATTSAEPVLLDNN